MPSNGDEESRPLRALLWGLAGPGSASLQPQGLAFPLAGFLGVMFGLLLMVLGAGLKSLDCPGESRVVGDPGVGVRAWHLQPGPARRPWGLTLMSLCWGKGSRREVPALCLIPQLSVLALSLLTFLGPEERRRPPSRWAPGLPSACQSSPKCGQREVSSLYLWRRLN